MRCNLSCVGCYAHDYPSDGEISTETVEALLHHAESMGVFVCIITGGEPLMREDILELFQRHRRILFIMITNGTLLDKQRAKKIVESRNVIPLLSIEGTREQTDNRRGAGVYDLLEQAMRFLREEKILFGFASTITKENFGTLGSSDFVEEMIGRGCVLGFFAEYVPIGTLARWDLILDDDERNWFREKVLKLRRSKSVLLAHLPDDEYGADNRCQAVVHGCVHINAQGYVEPCPFTHFASDNIREKPLHEILCSQFLSQIRSSEAVVRRGRLGCALFENSQMVKNIAARTGAKPTDGSPVSIQE